MNIKLQCPHCGSDNIRIFMPVIVSFCKAARGLLIPVENDPLVVDNYIWDQIKGECMDCEKSLPRDLLEKIDANDFYD